MDHLKIKTFAEIDLQCQDLKIVNKAQNFGGSLDILKSIENKNSCNGFSSIDTLHTNDCSVNLKLKLQSQINLNCIKKSKCKVKIDLTDIIQSCENYSFLDIYFVNSVIFLARALFFSCWAKLP